MSDALTSRNCSTPDSNIGNFFLFLLKRIPLTFLLAIFLYQIAQMEWIPYTGDGHYTEELTLKGWVVLMHSSLTTILHRVFYIILHPFGWRAWNAISFSSAFAGGIAIQALFAIRRNPYFLAINLLSGSFFVFVGEVESYAWVNLFLLFAFFGVEQFLQEKWRFWPACTFLLIAALFHMLAIFYLPALFWILRKYPRIKPWEFMIPFSVFLVSTVAILLLFPSEGLDLDLSRLTPLSQINRKGQLFTFFSLAHWELLAYFHWKSSFLQIFPLEIPLLLLLRRSIDTPFKQFLAICSLIGLGWTTVWHPDLGRLDWDLFSQCFIPIHVLLGLLVSDRLSKPSQSQIL